MSSQGTIAGTAEPVSQGTPIASAEPSGRASAGEMMESTKLHSPESFVHEWFEFVGMRTRQHMHLMKTIQSCRSLPDLQQAYSEFWQNAFAQYAEEPRRILRIT
jgi:hypothetical protein